MSQLREAMAAVKASPKNPAAWITLGDLLAGEGQGEKATQSYQRALQLDPTNSAAQRGLARLIIQNTGTPPASRPAPPAAPSQPTPEPRRAPPTETRRPVSPPQPHGTEEQISRVPRPTAAPRREEPATPAPRMEQSSINKATTAAFEMRERPAAPRKPSEGRLRAGLLFIAVVPLVCACVLVLVLARLF